MDDVDQQEKHGTKAQNRKNVREKHDVGVFGYREDGWNGIDGKDEVGKLDDQ